MLKPSFLALPPISCGVCGACGICGMCPGGIIPSSIAAVAIDALLEIL